MDSPTAVYQEMVSQYAAVGALAVLTWDILDNITGDYRILFAKQQNKWSIATLAYILSRVGAFAYALLSVIFETAPVGHCTSVNSIALAFCPISFGATGLLFFLRLRAVYNRDRAMVAIFFFLWLALLVGEALAPLSSKGAPVLGPDGVPTGYCEGVEFNALASYGLMAPLVFDTLVLLAISWRISRIPTMNETSGSVRKTVRTMLFGTGLPAFARSLLIDGQIYYLITVIFGIACAVTLFSPLMPLPLTDLLEDVYPAVINIMACRLFRRAKSGVIRESEISTSAADRRVLAAPVQVVFGSGMNSVETVSKNSEAKNSEATHVV